MQPTTLSPTGQPTTSSPTMQPTTARPTMAPTTLSPTQQPTTLSPTMQPTTLNPTMRPTTLPPTGQPTTRLPTKAPTTLSPTMRPTTQSPTKQPTTQSPTLFPTTRSPTMKPTTFSPTQQPTTLSPTMQPTTLSPTMQPTTLSPTMQPTTLSPTLGPVVCPIGTFTKDCLPLIAIDTIFPSGGLVTGGFVVRVQGFNFGNFSNATVMCQFGASSVSGTYQSRTEVACVAPDVSGLGVVVEESAVVVFSVSIGGLTSYNSVPFEFFGLCRRDACVNGFCAVAGCICESGYQGETCLNAVIPPRLKAVNSSIIQVRENAKYTYLATIEQGDLPILWSVSVDPSQDDVYMNPSTGALEWGQVKASVTGKPYNVIIVAENSGGSDSVSFQLEALSEYIIEGVRSTLSEVSSGPEVTLVPIEGYCLFRDNRSAVPFCEAEIVVTKDGFRRAISTVARQDGKIRVSFVPFDEEGGTFYLSGQPKGFRNDTIQDSFSRVGLAVIPRELRIVALTLEQIEESLTVLSLSDKVVLGGLSVSITSPIPPEIQNISIQLNSNVLAPKSNINATVRVVGRLPGTFVIQYKVSSNTTAFASGRLSLGFQAPTPVLVAEPPSIGLRAARGARSMAQIILMNAGGVPTGDLQAIMPAKFHLLQLASHSVIPSILPGESATVLFSSLPNATEPFQSWTGAMNIQSTTVSLRVDFHIDVVSNLVGNLVVITEDEATFHKEGNPPLNTSSVTIKNAVTLETFRRSVDATGSAVFANVSRGVYEVRATAAKHGEYMKMIEVTGADQIIYAFLPMQVVSYTWSVNPITLEEEYEIVLETTFTTFVPAPVVTIEPNELDLETLVPGEDQINFKITNHGFIAAKGVQLNLPPTNGLRFVPLLGRPIGDLPANSTIYYPVKVEYDSVPSGIGTGTGTGIKPVLSRGGDVGTVFGSGGYGYIYVFGGSSSIIRCGCAIEVLKCAWSLAPFSDCAEAIGGALSDSDTSVSNVVGNVFGAGMACMDYIPFKFPMKDCLSAVGSAVDVTKTGLPAVSAAVSFGSAATGCAGDVGEIGKRFFPSIANSGIPSTRRLTHGDQSQHHRVLLLPAIAAFAFEAVLYGISHADDLVKCFNGIKEECFDASVTGSSRFLLTSIMSSLLRKLIWSIPTRRW
ncbi:Coagulation factor 5/8 C-terminal domain [Fragilaria crotonensis]|nr:Coagulation factor 5/8 C-terminal domain [Fragilaria crotonensis]